MNESNVDLISRKIDSFRKTYVLYKFSVWLLLIIDIDLYALEKQNGKTKTKNRRISVKRFNTVIHQTEGKFTLDYISIIWSFHHWPDSLIEFPIELDNEHYEGTSKWCGKDVAISVGKTYSSFFPFLAILIVIFFYI